MSASNDRDTIDDAEATEPRVLIKAPVMLPEAPPPPATERTYLAVPFDEKDEAKQLGARWDRGTKAWYVPAGSDLEAFAAWLPAKDSVHIAVEANPVEQFTQALHEMGLRPDGPIMTDGSLQRVPVDGDRGKERSGAYKAHLDGKPAGYIQNFKTNTRTNWKANAQAASLGAQDRAQLAAEAAQKRHERAHEREQQAERAAEQVDALWAAATPCEAHPYLAAKGVQAHGLRQDEAGRLLVPVQDADGKIWSVQRISADGFKQFHEGGRIEGGHFVIGDVKRPGPLLIAEGFATAATVHELTDMPAIVAFNAGNLASVALTYRSLYPERAIYIAADNDHLREAEGKPNVGRESAERAAALTGGHVLLPAFAGNGPGSDWNDFAKLRGADVAQKQLNGAIAIASREQAVQERAAARERTERGERQVAVE